MSRRLLLLFLFALPLAAVSQNTIPATQAAALDDHTVTLPHDLSPTTVFIVGFSKKSSDNTTPWEKAVRTQLSTRPGIGFYEIAMLAEVPRFIRGLVVRSLRKEVPDVLKPRFLPLFTDEDAWKRAAAFDPAAPDAPYIVVVDAQGNVKWRTHASFSAKEFGALQGATQR